MPWVQIAVKSISNGDHMLPFAKIEWASCTGDDASPLLLIKTANRSRPHGLIFASKQSSASFSFSSPKIISTGQGGALITNDDVLAARIRKLKDFGRSTGGNDTHDVVGWNFKYTDMQGVVGIEQMKKLPWRVERMKAIWLRYCSHLQSRSRASTCLPPVTGWY